MSFNRLLTAVTLGAVLLTATAAWSQSYPAKAINVVVPYPAGGAADFVARFMSKEMSTTLNQLMLVDNVAGVGGALGTMKMLNAPPDGYSVLLSGVTEMVLTPLANVNAKYKSEDFKTVAMIGQADLMLVVRKELGVNNIAEFLELAKKRTDKPLSYCSTGVGSQYHLMIEKFNASAGTKALHLPYNGFPQCVTNLIGEVVDYAFLPMAGPFPGFVEKGSLKLLAIAGAQRNPKFPDAPALSQIRGFQDFVFTAWAGIHVSGKVSDEIVQILNKSALAAMETAEVKAQIVASGSIRFDLMNPKQAHEFYLREVAKYQATAKSINLQAQ